MASVAEAAGDGTASLTQQAVENEVVDNKNDRNQDRHETTRLNEMAEDQASDVAAAGENDDRGDPPADSGPVAGAQRDPDDTPAKPHEVSGSIQGHSRQTTAAETDDKASITHSVDQHGGLADKQPPEQQPFRDTPREKLVLEKYTLYKTESVSRSCRTRLRGIGSGNRALTL